MDVSGFGLRINLIASETFPNGLDITQLADDTNPTDAPSIQVRDKAMGANGDLVTWSKANPLLYSISPIPGSEDDLNLQALTQANRPARGRRPVLDEITLTVIYPSGRTARYMRGTLTDGFVANGSSNAGRLTTPTYQFAFEDVENA